MSKRLTPLMKKALMEKVRGMSISAGKGTVDALRRRRLLDDYDSLTMEGWRQAVVALPLREQCEHLDLELQKIAIPGLKGRPEIAAWKHFGEKGYIGSFCEGGAILVLIRASALDTLASLNTFNSRDDACVRFTEAQLTILANHSDQILQAIEVSTVDGVRASFEEIYDHDLVREWYPSLSSDGIAALYAVIGPQQISRIAAAIMEDPYTYRRGWPDLTLVREQSVLWAEVKTTDRLHINQVTTLQRMRKLLPGFVGVVQVKSA